MYQAGRDSGILRREKTRSKEEERRRKQAKRTWKSRLRLIRIARILRSGQFLKGEMKRMIVVSRKLLRN